MNILPDDIFSEIDKYWNKTIVYTFPKQHGFDEINYINYLYQRSTHFHDYIDVDDFPDFREGKLEFTFAIAHDLILEMVDDDFKHPVDEFAMKINVDIENCTCSKTCPNRKLMNFKRNILDELRINYMHYHHSLNRLNHLAAYDNYTETLNVCDYKCINCCIIVKENTFGRKLDNINTLYCEFCINRFKGQSREFYLEKYKEHISGLVSKYKNRYDEIINFLRCPLPKEYYISGYNNNKILFTLSEVV